MKDEIKEILDYIKDEREAIKDNAICPCDIFNGREIIKLYDYITNLQEENERLLHIAKKMHTYIFLNSSDEQKVYDELGLTDKENKMLGYSGQIILNGGDD